MTEWISSPFIETIQRMQPCWLPVNVRLPWFIFPSEFFKLLDLVCTLISTKLFKIMGRMHMQKELFWFYFQIYRWKNYIILFFQWSFYTFFISILFHWFVEGLSLNSSLQDQRQEIMPNISQKLKDSIMNIFLDHQKQNSFVYFSALETTFYHSEWVFPVWPFLNGG